MAWHEYEGGGGRASVDTSVAALTVKACITPWMLARERGRENGGGGSGMEDGIGGKAEERRGKCRWRRWREIQRRVVGREMEDAKEEEGGRVRETEEIERRSPWKRERSLPTLYQDLQAVSGSDKDFSIRTCAVKGRKG